VPSTGTLRKGSDLRVLVVHNAYSSRIPSGENVVVRDEIAGLREAGVDVELHEVSNDELVDEGPAGRARRLVETTWSRPAARRFDDAVRRNRPDVVHVHNLFPLLSASVPRVALRHGLPVVWSVHNRRLVCVKGGHFRADAPCHQCRPGWRAPGVWHGCYAESRGASALVTSATSLFRRMVRRRPITAVAPSRPMADWLTGVVGVPPERVHVKAHGVPPPTTSGAGSAGEIGEIAPDASRTLLFVGRLADYKGVHLLLDAWRRVGADDLRLVLVGDGPLAPDVAAAAADDPRVTWTGFVPPEEVATRLRRARAVLVPSRWEEPFGRVAVEAMAAGRPVVATGRGALADIVDAGCGWVVDADDPGDLARTVDHLAADDAGVAARGDAARRRYAERYSPAASTAALLALYDQVVARGLPVEDRDAVPTREEGGR
jgi:glycosyltransferase involved in cell wall biosynthesis